MLKYRILLSLLFLCIAHLTTAMETSSFSVCTKIKRLDPNASDGEYDNLVRELFKEKISVCDCIKQSLEKKFVKARQALHKEWQISDEHWSDIERFIEKVKKADSKKNRVHIERDKKHISSKLAKDIVEQFKFIGRRNNSIVFSYKPAENVGETGIRTQDVSVNRVITANEDPFDVANKRLKTEVINAEQYTLKFGPDYFAHSNQARLGILQHEMEHVKQDDSLISSLLFWTACIYKPDLLNSGSNFRKSSSVLLYDNAKEIRADRLPACASVNNALLHEKVCVERRQVLEAEKQKGALKIIDETGTHSPIEKQVIWAIRIRKLKEAEDRLLNNSK